MYNLQHQAVSWIEYRTRAFLQKSVENKPKCIVIFNPLYQNISFKKLTNEMLFF